MFCSYYQFSGRELYCEGFDDLINKVRSVIKFVKSSTNLTELRQHQIDSSISENAIKELILDIEMQWNNVFCMIKRFVKLWNVINKVLAKHETPEMPSLVVEGVTGSIEITKIHGAGMFG